MSDGGMNEWLADFYGTGAGGDELEKVAQAALLEKLAEGDIDIDSLSDEEVVELAAELGIGDDADDADGHELDDHQKVAMISKLAEVSDIDISELDEDQFNELAAAALNPETWGDGEQLSDHEKIAMITKVAEANDIDIAELNEDEFNQLSEIALSPETWEGDEETKLAEAQFAEADFLGRVMAHAQHDELRKMSAVLDAKGNPIASGSSAAKRQAGRLRDRITARVRPVGAFLGAQGERAEGFGRKGTDYIGRKGKAGGLAIGRGGKHVGRFAMKHRGKAGIAALLASIGAGTYGGYKVTR